MKREIVQTGDGSTTIHLPEWEESYHSKHGAVQEAYHVFIHSGLSLFDGKSVAVLEIGFGTGLNAFITWIEHQKRQQTIDYVGVEAYPVLPEEAALMNYPSALQALEQQFIFEQMHAMEWEKAGKVSEHFTLTKRQQFFQDIADVDRFDLVYFDAFGFRVQPELWDVAIFQKMYTALRKGGVLVTYACRTSIKKAMLEVGFEVEKLPGAPGKREMLRAFKK
ncbi:tRNA (5-methylaminomethyl-2-thiouridine)(34)-methyltransferase MnmD [Flavobacterium stagni]|uniref:SAM-dependent methyltransferase n=1 Tax=Flavobacterium stagni TaxID=2506421 RepID=A0A4V1N2G4_9FLAO|nr:tRNA (5-methylaminomethyl-2-thiouridine)(34)-methyltransferase MnmD [Flavobacterium stagni]RXR21650.1 SAM-dependent methyltransferase [Flavobacterium stagni]